MVGMHLARIPSGHCTIGREHQRAVTPLSGWALRAVGVARDEGSSSDAAGRDSAIPRQRHSPNCRPPIARRSVGGRSESRPRNPRPQHRKPCFPALESVNGPGAPRRHLPSFQGPAAAIGPEGVVRTARAGRTKTGFGAGQLFEAEPSRSAFFPSWCMRPGRRSHVAAKLTKDSRLPDRLFYGMNHYRNGHVQVAGRPRYGTRTKRAGVSAPILRGAGCRRTTLRDACRSRGGFGRAWPPIETTRGNHPGCRQVRGRARRNEHQ